MCMCVTDARSSVLRGCRLGRLAARSVGPFMLSFLMFSVVHDLKHLDIPFPREATGKRILLKHGGIRIGRIYPHFTFLQLYLHLYYSMYLYFVLGAILSLASLSGFSRTEERGGTGDSPPFLHGYLMTSFGKQRLQRKARCQPQGDYRVAFDNMTVHR